MRANTNISHKERRTVTLADFRGVDLTTSPLRVAPSRATSMRNLINDHGINHKRPGWCEMLQLDGRINGIFPYQYGGKDVLLVHAGTAFYEVTEDASTGLWKAEKISKDGWGLTDTRSQCVYHADTAYILGCGSYLAYGKHGGETHRLVPVSEIAYVPTTTVGIEKTGLDASGRGTLDRVNLLTPLRKNELIGAKDDNSYWNLDGVADEGSAVVLEYITYSSTYAEIVHRFEGTVKNKQASLVSKTEQGIFTLSGQALYCTTIDTSSVEGLTVMFSCSTDGYADRVHRAKFGTLFGTKGAANRLFVCGNPDHPDMDFWSEIDDFTYFPDGNAMVIGGDQRPVTGYARLSDSTLAIFKESLAGEPSIYYRTGAETTQLDADGETVPAQYFPTVAGSAGEGSVSHHASANLAGDVLILSPDGVRGVELSANVASGERYTRDRGRAIYEDLRKRDLTEAVATVWRGRYFLACGDGVCYVADSRYKTTFEGSTDTGYEWWVWDNVPARVFAVYKDKLLFGAADGMVCAFVEGSFADCLCGALGSGDLLNEADGTLDYADSLQLHVGDRVVLRGNVYDRVAVSTYDAESDVYQSGDVGRLFDGMTVLLDGQDGEFEVDEVDVVANTFALYKGETRWIVGSPITLLVPLANVPLYVADENDPTTLARGYGYDENGERVWNKVFLTTKDGESAQWTGRYMIPAPVVAEWYSGVMDMGTNVYAKSLLGFTVAGEPGICGRVTFGYETRRHEAHQALAVRGGGSAFSFEDVDFSDYSFDTAFATAYTRSANVRNFNFIACRWRSEEDTDSAVSGITLTYKVNRKNRGVR